MATALDAELVPLALALVTEFGLNAEFEVMLVSQYDAESGGTIETGPVTRTKKVSPPSPFEQRFIDGVAIRQDDLEVYLPGSGLEFTPAVDMTVRIGRVAYRVVTVGPIHSGELVAVYRLQLRR